MNNGGKGWARFSPQDWANLANTYGTPFYLFDADRIVESIDAVSSALDHTISVYYAVKANPNLGLLRTIRPHVAGLDISSDGELAQAMLAGYACEQMSFAGPSKTDRELHSAIEGGVGCISVESMREIDACVRIARELGKPANIAIRVNPRAPSPQFGLKMGGRPVQFGIDEESLREAVARILHHNDTLVLRGVHVYVGSQCFDAAGVVDATANALRLAAQIEELAGTACSKVNLGGGFGVAHSDKDRRLSLEALREALTPLLVQYKKAKQGTELIFELGRYITAEAGIYVTSVVSSKLSRGRKFVTCDGGLNHHLAAAGTFGAALRATFPLRNLTNPDANVTACSIAGPSCNPTDLLGIDVELPGLTEGDLVGVLMSGSYGLTASPLLFLGRTTPVELVLRNGKIIVGRQAHALTDFN